MVLLEFRQVVSKVETETVQKSSIEILFTYVFYLNKNPSLKTVLGWKWVSVNLVKKYVFKYINFHFEFIPVLSLF